MSMDKLLRADEQEYVSPPIKFSDFAAEALAAHTAMEKTMNSVRDQETTLQKQLAATAGISMDTSCAVMNHVDAMLAEMRGVEPEEYNFDVEEGLDDQAVEDGKFRTLELLQHERERRLNKQNKSIALRAMKYDFMEPDLLAQRKRGRESLEQWRSLLSGEQQVDEEPDFDDYGEELPMKKKEYCTRDQAEEFLAAEPSSLRSDNLPWPKGDIVVHASVYLGYSRTLEYHEVRLGRLMKVTDRLLLSGQSTLVDLKKAFHCPADYMVLDDVSNRNVCQDDLCKNRFPSSFFFIHDTFYVDIEPEGSIDISHPIRQWAASRPAIGEVRVKTMDQKKLCNLYCRLGQPYVYVHQGNCEHLIVFTDIHLRSLNDPMGPYPIRLRERAFRRITCAACGNDGAEWSVMDCEMLPTTPAYMCDTCYREFLFFDSGRKRCEFKSVPYFDRKAMDDTELFLSKLQIKPCKKPLKVELTGEEGEQTEWVMDHGDCAVFENSRPGFDDLFAAAAQTSEEEEEEEEKGVQRKKVRRGYEEDSDDIGSDDWESGESDDMTDVTEDESEDDEEKEEDHGEDDGEEMHSEDEEVVESKKPVVKETLEFPDSSDQEDEEEE